MFRVRPSLLVVLGLSLLATRFISSADSSPRMAAPAEVAAGLAEADIQDPTLETMRAEVERMRDRSQSTPASAPPARDPFNFGRQPERPRPVVAAVVVDTPVEVHPVLPQLVAVLTDKNDAGNGANVRTAVFATTDSVVLLSSGESIGAFRIDSISPEAVDLLHRDSGRHYALSLK